MRFIIVNKLLLQSSKKLNVLKFVSAYFSNSQGHSLVFQANCLFFFKQKSNLLVKKSNSLTSLFCHERREQIANGCSLVKSHWSDSLTMKLFLQSDESKLLPLLFKKEQLSEERQERFAPGHKKGGKL